MLHTSDTIKHKYDTFGKHHTQSVINLRGFKYTYDSCSKEHIDLEHNGLC